MEANWVAGEIEARADAVGDTERSVLILDGKDEARVVFDGFVERGWKTFRSSGALHSTDALDLIVLHGYRHIIPAEVIARSRARIVNLHSAFLPFNRGAHPIFWCFYDGTPCGVTIHYVDNGLDTGPIIAQRTVDIDPWQMTFEDAHRTMRDELESLLWAELDAIVSGRATPKAQLGVGTLHRVADLPDAFTGWSVFIGPEIARLHDLKLAEAIRAQALIDEIEKVRSANNVNWMDLLRLAFSEAPESARTIMRKINADDHRIGDLLKMLGSDQTEQEREE